MKDRPPTRFDRTAADRVNGVGMIEVKNLTVVYPAVLRLLPLVVVESVVAMMNVRKDCIADTGAIMDSGWGRVRSIL